MSNPYHVEFLKFAHGMVVSATTWPDDKVTAQAAGQPNHCLWTLGHLATTYDWGAGLLDGKPSALPESYNKLFGMGSVPSPDPKAYPSLAEVRSHFDRTFERLAAAATALTAAQGAESLKEATQGFASTKLDMVHKLAWHDGWHLGQLATLRKFLGLPGLLS
ncbi:MAG: DinB family protein [Phycisphaerae bacterium]|nr:DinB family protein [Phycisphaerae bacterium]